MLICCLLVLLCTLSSAKTRMRRQARTENDIPILLQMMGRNAYEGDSAPPLHHHAIDTAIQRTRAAN
jgi:hypothetical protein